MNIVALVTSGLALSFRGNKFHRAETFEEATLVCAVATVRRKSLSSRFKLYNVWIGKLGEWQTCCFSNARVKDSFHSINDKRNIMYLGREKKEYTNPKGWFRYINTKPDKQM